MRFGDRCPVSITTKETTGRVDGVVLSACVPRDPGSSYWVDCTRSGGLHKIVELPSGSFRFRRIELASANENVPPSSEGTSVCMKDGSTAVETGHNGENAVPDKPAAGDGSVKRQVIADQRQAISDQSSIANTETASSYVPSTITTCNDSLKSRAESKSSTGKRKHTSYDSRSVGSAKSPKQQEVLIKTPDWLQGNKAELFRFLIGKRRNNVSLGVPEIGRRTGTRITVDDPHYAVENLSVRVEPFRLEGSVDSACRQVMYLLLDYLDKMRDPNAKARLLFDISSGIDAEWSRGKATRPGIEVAGMVSRSSYLAAVDLPCQRVAGDRLGEHFCIPHASFLQSNIVRDLARKNQCRIKAYAEMYGFDVKFCNPYVQIVGEDRILVDQVAALLEQEITKHMSVCKRCGF